MIFVKEIRQKVLCPALLIETEQPTRAQKIIVEERLDGTLHISYKGQDLKFREITKQSTKERHKPIVLIPVKKIVLPSPDHPWKRPYKAQRRGQEQPLAVP